MDISKRALRIVQKPPILVVIPIIYFFIVMLAKWQLNLPFGALWFFLGGLLGLYLLDIAEALFEVKPSPFRTIIFVIGLVIVGFYTITSTREMIASGVVLGLMLTLFLYQVSEWRLRDNLQSWYTMFLGTMPRSTQRIGLVVFALVLLWQTVMFIIG